MNTTPIAHIDFSPKWYHDRFGLEFGERFWLDPIARTELHRNMRRLMHEVFADVGLGEADPKPMPNIEAYGHRFMSAFWGCEIHYQADQAPAAIVLDNPDERIESFEMPSTDLSKPIQKALSEAKLLESRYGSCDPMINGGGPLNNAVSVFGEDILAAIALRPLAAQRALMLMVEGIFAVYDALTARLTRAGPAGKRALVGIGNCPVSMISPEMYRQVVLPADQHYFRGIQGRGLHHCGAFHPYAQVYKALEPDALQIGYTSDRRMTRDAYPGTPISLLLEASAIAGQTPSTVRNLVHEMLDQAAPMELITDIAVSDVGPEVSDDAVKAFVESLPKRA